MSSHLDKYWLAIIVFLLLCLISGGIILTLKLNSQHPVEISVTSTKPPDYQLQVYIDGAVTNPGFYPAKENDSITDLMRSAGLTSDADSGQLKIYIPKIAETGSEQKPQKINLNRADVWLLEALPGIGQSKAQAIVDYRNKYGHFLRIDDLLKVSGISKSIMDNIRSFITVEN